MCRRAIVYVWTRHSHQTSQTRSEGASKATATSTFSFYTGVVLVWVSTVVSDRKFSTTVPPSFSLTLLFRLLTIGASLHLWFGWSIGSRVRNRSLWGTWVRQHASSSRGPLSRKRLLVLWNWLVWVSLSRRVLLPAPGIAAMLSDSSLVMIELVETETGIMLFPSVLSQKPFRRFNQTLKRLKGGRITHLIIHR